MTADDTVWDRSTNRSQHSLYPSIDEEMEDDAVDGARDCDDASDLTVSWMLFSSNSRVEAR